ncbi:8-oxo-dGTP diphosphatase [Planococcus sp. A6]|uniref:NUDIX hydrolase n=1 Tax=Planococcus sp. A6 TaxID=2992760 RepID=UPI00237A6308|nr:8-oxo-dGTP diphosphatase [Planococcus sp. A6]MDE0583427.1 8-oxo-dGTP diphosphatase [Planococcus sp. A6]
MLKYTLCLIRNGDKILLLNREKSPQMGMWNGVGEKIEPGETPLESAIRETFEETGIRLTDMLHAGNVLFTNESSRQGMYLFMADLPETQVLATPLGTREGILDWKSIDWILQKDNRGVAANLRAYLPSLLNGDLGLEHCIIYKNREIAEYTAAALSEAIQA